MDIFWINLEIQFKEEVSILNAKNDDVLREAQGFFQEFGCTDIDEKSAKEQIQNYLRELDWFDASKMKVKFPRIGTIDSRDVDSEIYSDEDINSSLIGEPSLKGLWYISGKAFYSDQLDDDEFYQIEF